MVDKYKTFGKYLGFERGFFLFEEIHSKLIIPITKNHIHSIGEKHEPRRKRKNISRDKRCIEKERLCDSKT